jgi:lipoprotein-anchoring transpeptidase ErfK/SrfK
MRALRNQSETERPDTTAQQTHSPAGAGFGRRNMYAVVSDKLINLAAAAFVSAFALFNATPSEAANKIVARVDISQQRMDIYVNGEPTFAWKVSTAGEGYVTPKGTFKPTRMHEMWYSKQYDNAPMPHSVFFHEGYAVHATNAIKRLGQPASHGCIRLHPSNAADFYTLVQAFGAKNTSIVIVE